MPQPLELRGRRVGRGGRRRDRRRRAAGPAAQRQHQEHSSDEDDERGREVARQVEAALGRRHQDRDAALAHECIQDLLRALALLRQRDHVLVHRRARRAGEVGRPAGVDVQAATAGAVEAFLDRLNRSVVIGGYDGLERAAGARRIPQAAGGAGAGEGIDGLSDCRTEGQDR